VVIIKVINLLRLIQEKDCNSKIWLFNPILGEYQELESKDLIFSRYKPKNTKR